MNERAITLFKIARVLDHREEAALATTVRTAALGTKMLNAIDKLNDTIKNMAAGPARAIARGYYRAAKKGLEPKIRQLVEKAWVMRHTYPKAANITFYEEIMKLAEADKYPVKKWTKGLQLKRHRGLEPR